MANYSDFGSVKMRLNSLGKRHIAILFILYLIAIFGSVVVGFFGPKITNTVTLNGNNLNPKVENLKTGPYFLQTPILNKFHQQLWFNAQPNIEQRQEELIVKLNLKLHIHNEKNKEINEHLEYFNRSRTLHCKNENCDDLSLFHLDYLHSDRYLVDLRILDLDNSTINFKDIVFNFKTYNPNFTKFELWTRFIFLIITFIVLVIFSNSLNKYAFKDWTIEQKWVFVLLRGLVFYNNPLFPLVVLVDGWIPDILDRLFQTSFLCSILLFWLSIYHGFRQHDRKCFKFYFPKSILVGVIWMLSLLIGVFQKYHSLYDPTYNLAIDEKDYQSFQIIFLIFMGLYGLYLLFLVIRSWDMRKMPFFDVRLKFSLGFMLIVLLTLTVTALLKLDPDAIKQNLFEHMTKNYNTTLEFILVFTLLNFYVFIIAFAYSPAIGAAYDTDFCETTAFSMLNNDSDEEDVIYGSDTEEMIRKK